MTSTLAQRLHLMITFVLVVCGTVGGGCLGVLWGGWITALVAAAAAGLGAGTGSFLARRQVLAFLRPDATDAVGGDGYAQGIADAVLVGIATYQAAAFPLTPDGVSDEERDARRTVAYRIAAHEGLPLPVRVSAAAALEAIDEGHDTESAHSAMKALSLSVYEHRTARR
ncbi:hypothetical protein EES41_38075 (plasmid) [Streptomyces sp. ADI95-16]|uniref:hypothetical protein n=1 Tax=Streptomyces sp. ADI95-16 TaxID=1522758 RepID=UPI000F43717C|nr:hypothetical protein [Streptomyces sp. ADI95-16]AYV32576.1 hypothetical protein EES41_38075 [Streptomyces sp. ADI95-16]